jgi:hypothetical protein
MFEMFDEIFDLYDHPPYTISEAIDYCRYAAQLCALAAGQLRHFAEPGVCDYKDPNLPSRICKEVADLGDALGYASRFVEVEHWFTGPKPVEFASAWAGSIHAVTLKLSERIHRAAALAIKQVHDRYAERERQTKLKRVMWERKDNSSPNEIRGRSRGSSPFIITYETNVSDLVEAWHADTWDALRDSLIRQPLFDIQLIMAKIDCEWARAKQRFETGSHELDRLRPDESSCDTGANGVDSDTAAPLVIMSKWPEPIIVRGNRKELSYTKWLLIRGNRPPGFAAR